MSEFFTLSTTKRSIKHCEKIVSLIAFNYFRCLYLWLSAPGPFVATLIIHKYIVSLISWTNFRDAADFNLRFGSVLSVYLPNIPTQCRRLSFVLPLIFIQMILLFHCNHYLFAAIFSNFNYIIVVMPTVRFRLLLNCWYLSLYFQADLLSLKALWL